MGFIAEAIRQWQEAINFYPYPPPDCQLALAVAFYVKGEQEKAFQMAETALKLNKHFADLEFFQKTLWDERLLADAQKLFSTPRIRAFLSSE